jgi:hypothetical protein
MAARASSMYFQVGCARAGAYLAVVLFLLAALAGAGLYIRRGSPGRTDKLGLGAVSHEQLTTSWLVPPRVLLAVRVCILAFTAGTVGVLLSRAGVLAAEGEYVIKYRFQSKRAQRYIRLQRFPSL